MKIALNLERCVKHAVQGRPTWEHIDSIGPMESDPHQLMLRMVEAGWDKLMLDPTYRIKREFVHEMGEDRHSFIS